MRFCDLHRGKSIHSLASKIWLFLMRYLPILESVKCYLKKCFLFGCVRPHALYALYTRSPVLTHTHKIRSYMHTTVCNIAEKFSVSVANKSAKYCYNVVEKRPQDDGK